MNVLIAGDFCPQNRVGELLRNGDWGQIFDDVRGIMVNVDYSIVNLECPLTTHSSQPIHKQGPCLCCQPEVASIIRSVGFTCVSMANNHILDYGSGAVNITIKEIQKEGLDYVGGGRNLTEASSVLYKKIKGQKLAIINCCEHEFSIARDNQCGANPLNPITQYYQIKKARDNADYVVMIIHGGIEHFQYPTSRMIQTYRFFVDAGADAVINHHQHCPCGYEIYKGKPIYYGLGNFCFDWDGKRNSIWNLGYLVKLNLGDDHKISSEIIPYRQCDETPMVNLLGGKELEGFNSMMRGLCEAIQNPDILDAMLKEFNVKNDYLYRKMLEPYAGRVANGMYRRGWLPSTISKERVLALMDFLICESHHERVKELLERLYKQYFNE